MLLVQLVDIAAEARAAVGAEIVAEIYGRDVAEDWRFQVTYNADRHITSACPIADDGDGRITFHRGATAEHVVEYLQREGIA